MKRILSFFLLSVALACSLQGAMPILDAKLTGDFSQVLSGVFTVQSGAELVAASGSTLTIESGATVALGDPLSLANGGTGEALADPGADRILFWDESGDAVAFLTVGSGLSISGTTITSTFTNPMTTAGDLIVGGVSGAPSRLAIGTDGQVLTVTSGAVAWGTAAASAPADAAYIVQTPSSGLSGEQALSALGTGLLKNTTTTGVLSIGAAGTDYVAPGAITTSGLTMATARLLGRTTASTGAAEEITVGSGLSLSAGALTAMTEGQATTVGAYRKTWR